jgi:hypothetical protein
MPRHAESTFIVKDGADGKPVIVAEPTAEALGLSVLIGFDLRAGTTLATAKQLAHSMRMHIEGTSIT